jgi:hypothetical protein
MTSRTADISLGVTSLAIAALVYWSADQIPPSLIAQVSAGLVPKIVSVCLAGLALGQIWMTIRQGGGSLSASAASGRKLPVLVTAILLGLFILLLDTGLIGFEGAGFLFVLASVMALSPRSLRSLLIAVAVAGISVAGTVILFTRVFTVILP